MSGSEAWQAIRCVATDGGAAFPAALEEVLPGVPQLRCLFHIYQNLSKQLISKLGGDAYHGDFSTRFNRTLEARTEKDFETEWKGLVSAFPKASQYLSDHLYPCRMKWAPAWTLEYCTFGARSSQRVESMNSLLKLCCDANDPLSKIFEAITKIDSAQTRRRVAALQDAPFTNSRLDGPVYNAASRHLTKQAAELVQRESTYHSNYTATYHDPPPSAAISAVPHR